MNKWWWLIIFLFALVLRFGNYDNRWALNQDEGRDASIALYANRNGVWPQVGSPSSAGPFNFGPWYFWLIMFWERVLPITMGPWIGFTLLSVVSVICFAKVGQLVAGKEGMIITGLVATVSAGQVNGAPDMLNTVIVGFSSALAFLGMAQFMKKNNLWWGLLVGVAVGWSINVHFQSLGLLSLPLVMVLINKFSIIKRIRIVFISGIGLLLTFLPVIFFDIERRGVWIRSVIEYYTVGVKRYYVPLRWLTELKDFWPQLFGSVTVGMANLGYIWVILGAVVVFLLWKKKEKIDNFWWAIGLSMLIQVILMRMYQGPRSGGYLYAFHGLIILISSWILINVYKFNKKIGIGLMVLMMSLAVYSSVMEVLVYPSQAKDILAMKRKIDASVGGKVRIFNYDNSNMIAMPMFYLYYFENRVSEDGVALGFCNKEKYICPEGQIIEKRNYRVYKLDELVDVMRFNQLTPKYVYEILMVNYGVE